MLVTVSQSSLGGNYCKLLPVGLMNLYLSSALSLLLILSYPPVEKYKVDSTEQKLSFGQRGVAGDSSYRSGVLYSLWSLLLSDGWLEGRP